MSSLDNAVEEVTRVQRAFWQQRSGNDSVQWIRELGENESKVAFYLEVVYQNGSRLFGVRLLERTPTNNYMQQDMKLISAFVVAPESYPDAYDRLASYFLGQGRQDQLVKAETFLEQFERVYSTVKDRTI